MSPAPVEVAFCKTTIASVPEVKPLITEPTGTNPVVDISILGNWPVANVELVVSFIPYTL